MSSGHNTTECLCPVCHSYLLDKHLNLKKYKSCNSCGYAREIVTANYPVIPDSIGEGISPILDKPELIRPEDR